MRYVVRSKEGNTVYIRACTEAEAERGFLLRYPNDTIEFILEK